MRACVRVCVCTFARVYVCCVYTCVHECVHVQKHMYVCMIYTLYPIQAVELAAQESPSALRDYVKCVCRNDPEKVSCSIQV